MSERVCNHGWKASRVEVDTIDVNHVCALVLDHPGQCRCSCGAIEALRTCQPPSPDTEVWVGDVGD